MYSATFESKKYVYFSNKFVYIFGHEYIDIIAETKPHHTYGTYAIKEFSPVKIGGIFEFPETYVKFIKTHMKGGYLWDVVATGFKFKLLPEIDSELRIFTHEWNEDVAKLRMLRKIAAHLMKNAYEVTNMLFRDCGNFEMRMWVYRRVDGKLKFKDSIFQYQSIKQDDTGRYVLRNRKKYYIVRYQDWTSFAPTN